jgi:hypothetical protein
MNREFVVSFSPRDAPALSQTSSLPNELLVPIADQRVSLSDLVGGRLWILLNGGSAHRLVAVVRVVRAVGCPDDGYKHMLAISLNPCKSVRIVGGDTQTGLGWVGGVELVDRVVVPCASGRASEFLRLASSLRHVVPDGVRLDRDFSTWTPSDGESVLGSRLQKILESGPIDRLRIPASVRAVPLSAPAALLLSSTRTASSADREALIETLARLDPLAAIEQVPEGNVEPQSSKVDVNLVAATSNVVARTFSSSRVETDACFALASLERAEGVHQAAIAELVKVMRSRGLSPLFSRSVDLAFFTGGTLHLVEVKSVTPSNADDQLGRAIIQLARYELAFRCRDTQACRSSVVLVSPLPFDCPRELSLIARRFSVGLVWVAPSVSGVTDWGEAVGRLEAA